MTAPGTVVPQRTPLVVGSGSPAPAAGGASAAPQAPYSVQGDPFAQALKQTRGEDYPCPKEPDGAKTGYVDQLHRDGEAEALARYKQATKNLLYMNGRQHIDWLPGKKVWDELPKGKDEIRVTMNYIRPIVRSRAQRLLSGPIDFTIIPRSNSYEDRDRALVGCDVLEARVRQLRLTAKIRAGLELAFCSGACAVKSFWNPSLGPATPATAMVVTPDPMTGAPTQQEVPIDVNGQPVDDPAMAYQFRPGDSDAALRTIFNLRMNPEATGWTPGEGLRWLIDSEVVPLATAREKFPELAAKINPMQGQETYLTYERIAAGASTQRAQQMQATTAAAATAKKGTNRAELTVIREYWELPSSFFPAGRLIVIVGGVVAYDGEFPQGIFPYAPLFDETGTLSPFGRPCVNDMLSPQDVINQQWAAIGREMRAAGTGQFVSWAIPGLSDQFSNASDGLIRVPVTTQTMGKSIRDVFHRLENAQVPADRWRMIEKAETTLFNVGAYHEVTRGQIPPGVSSGVAIDRLLESEAGQLSIAVNALKETLITIARHQLAICKWGYGADEARMIPVDRPDLRYRVESITGAQLPDPDTLDIDLENFRPHSQAALRGEIKDLLQARPDFPLKEALKAMDLGRGVEALFDSQGRDYARARLENLAFERGQVLAIPQGMTMDEQSGALAPMPPVLLHPEDLSPFLLPDDDDHAVHIDVHYEIAKDDTKPWPVRQMILTHIAEHRQAMQAMMMAASAAMAPAPGPGDGDGDEPPSEDAHADKSAGGKH